MSARKSRYGWIPDLPDYRDHVYAAPADRPEAPPPRADLRPKCPAVPDQGSLGSGVACVLAAAHQFAQMNRGAGKDFAPSRLFIYYNQRAMENTVKSDSGGQIRDGLKSLLKRGVCQEDMWPHRPAMFSKRPSAACYKEALRHADASYQRLPRGLEPMKRCLASGFPIILGITVYEGFEYLAVAKSGTVDLPRPRESALGGQAALAVGYDDASRRFLLMNTWGPNWGRRGYFTLPYEYLTDPGLSGDFWTLRVGP